MNDAQKEALREAVARSEELLKQQEDSAERTRLRWDREASVANAMRAKLAALREGLDA